MTRVDILALEPGDSVIGLGNLWVDELPVVAVGELVNQPDGQVRRTIHVRQGRVTRSARVREGDRTIRGARR